jgi:hypothetical protein
MPLSLVLLGRLARTAGSSEVAVIGPRTTEADDLATALLVMSPHRHAMVPQQFPSDYTTSTPD